MKRNNIGTVLFFITCLFFFTGCTVVAGIFKTGVWVGVLAVVLIIVGIIVLITKAGKK